MFTGLIEAVRPIISNSPVTGGRQLCLSLDELADDAKPGDSICVNGACLTIGRLVGRKAYFDIMAETLRVSTLDKLKAGDKVNLERAMRADGRFGGHIVQGHVDGIGLIEQIERGKNQHIMWIATEPELMKLCIGKGSIAVDGVSLTIAQIQKQRFSVSLIATTLKDTNLGLRKPSDKVNLEADLISKMIDKRLNEILPQNGKTSLSIERLRQQGFE